MLAHNEEQLIAPVLRGYLAQETRVADLAEIVVISCGSTDATVERAASVARDASSVRVIVRPERLGKLAAIHTFVQQAAGDVLVVAGADVIPSKCLIEQLASPFLTDASCGMTGPRVEPHTAQQPRLVSRLHEVLWRLHHEIAMRSPKLGEVVAVHARHFRRALPSNVHCDEVLLESRVQTEHGHLKYVPAATVTNFAPGGVRALFRQRRRVACQHVAARRYLHYRPASRRAGLVIRTVGSFIRRRPRNLLVIVGLGMLEVAARIAGRVDFYRGETYQTWAPASRPPVPAEQNPAA